MEVGTILKFVRLIREERVGDVLKQRRRRPVGVMLRLVEARQNTLRDDD